MSEPTPSLSKRATDMVERYGMTFVAVSLAIFAVEMVVLVTLLQVGIDVRPWLASTATKLGLQSDGLLAAAGTVGIAYAITRLIKPFSLALAFALTPFADRLWQRLRGAKDRKGEESPL